MNFFYVACGGALGACLRYAIALLVGSGSLPWATLVTKRSGSFAIGVVRGLCAEQEWFNAWGKLFLVGGLLGGFTTFWAFSLDSIKFLEDGRLLPLVSYLVSTITGCLLAVRLGLRMSQ
jgi:CrcB protein